MILQYTNKNGDPTNSGIAPSSMTTGASSNSKGAKIKTNYGTNEIMLLWKMYPEAVLVADPTTRLYPFQSLAAAVRPSFPLIMSTSSSSSYNNSADNGDCVAYRGGTKRKNNGRKPKVTYNNGGIHENNYCDDGKDTANEKLSIAYQFLRSAPEVLRLINEC